MNVSKYRRHQANNESKSISFFCVYDDNHQGDPSGIKKQNTIDINKQKADTAEASIRNLVTQAEEIHKGIIQAHRPGHVVGGSAGSAGSADPWAGTDDDRPATWGQIRFLFQQMQKQRAALGNGGLVALTFFVSHYTLQYNIMNPQ